KFVLRSEIFRHRNDEHSVSAVGKKMGGVSPVLPAWVDTIIGGNGNIEFLLGVGVVISDQKNPGPILVNEPAFKGSGHTRAELLARLGDLLTQQQYAAGDGTGGAQTEDSFHC